MKTTLSKAPRTTYRALAQFRHELKGLFREVIATPYVTSSEVFASLLRRHTRLFAAALLYAIDQGNQRSLPSLSYHLINYRVSPIAIHLGFKSAKAKVARVAQHSGRKPIVFHNNNSECVFWPKFASLGKEMQNDLELLAQLYNYTVMSSHNYKNYVRANIYRQGKPQGRTALYPKFDSVEDVCQTLAKTYGVEAQHFVYIGKRRRRTAIERNFSTYDQRSIHAYCGQRVLSNSFIRDLLSVIRVRQSRIGTLSGPLRYYAVFPVFDPNGRASEIPPDGIVIVLSKLPLGLFLMRAAEEWLSAFSWKRYLQKANILSNAETQALKAIAEIGDNASLDKRLQTLKSIADDLCEEVCTWTHAESVSVRTIDRDAGVLQKVAGFHSNWGSYRPEVLKKQGEELIPLTMRTRSFNAFAVAYPKSGVLHIEDIASIPPAYRRLGLVSVLQNHKFTRTEAVARIVSGSSTIGVMNIEAPVAGSLRHHLEFFGQCANFLGDLYRRLFSLSDSSGLTELAKTQVDVHSVADMVRKWKDGDKDGATMIVRRFKEFASNSAKDITSTSDRKESYGRTMSFNKGRDIGADVRTFNRTLRDWISFLIGAKGYTTLNANSIVVGSLPSHFDSNLLPSIFVIVNSIVENIAAGVSLDKHRLVFTDSFLGFPKPRSLTIEWLSHTPMRSSVDRNSILLLPLTDAAGTSHFGFFLIGVHVRQQGGIAAYHDLVDDERRPTGFRLVVSVPYTPRRRTIKTARRATQ